jgi:hypothetical protein
VFVGGSDGGSDGGNDRVVATFDPMDINLVIAATSTSAATADRTAASTSRQLSQVVRAMMTSIAAA